MIFILNRYGMQPLWATCFVSCWGKKWNCVSLYCWSKNHYYIYLLTVWLVSEWSSIHWWLIRSTLTVCFGFFVQIFLGRWWGPTNVICCSVNVDWVVVLLGGCGDTSNLLYVIELVWTLCIQQWWRHKNLVFLCLCALHVRGSEETSTFHSFIPRWRLQRVQRMQKLGTKGT